MDAGLNDWKRMGRWNGRKSSPDVSARFVLVQQHRIIPFQVQFHGLLAGRLGKGESVFGNIQEA